MTTPYPPETLVTTFIQMTAPQQFKPFFVDVPEARIEQLGRVDVPFYRFLYRTVGEAFRWRDRNFMTDEELAQTLAKAHIFLLSVSGVPAGYMELVIHEGNDVEIDFFGLRPDYHGMGLGKHLLSYGIQTAWQAWGAKRVWLHTCNLDSPRALENYLKRGFSVYKEEREPMPERYK